MMLSNHLTFSCPLLLLPSIFPSIRVFSNELVLCIRWPKYWSFTFSISLSNEYSGLISFRIDWFDHIAVYGTLKSLPEYHNLETSIFWYSLVPNLTLVLLYGPNLTSIQDYWKNHGFHYTDLIDKLLSLLF